MEERDSHHRIARIRILTMLDFLSPRKLLTQLTLGAGLVAAQLQTITNFGPTYSTQLQMQAYIPNNLPSNPAVILAVSNPQKLSGLRLTRYSVAPLRW